MQVSKYLDLNVQQKEFLLHLQYLEYVNQDSADTKQHHPYQLSGQQERFRQAR